MTFKYYIVNMPDGTVVGTSDETVMASYSGSDDFFVICPDRNAWVVSEVDNEIPNAK